MHTPGLAEQAGEAVPPVLDFSSTYAFSDTAVFADASQKKVGAGYVYARWANRTVDVFEAAVADLEGTEAAEAFSSGMAAISAIFLALCRSGDRVVAVKQLYGNTYSLLTDRLPRYGINTDFFDLEDYEGITAALPGAQLLYCETIGNPRVQVADLDKMGEMASAAGIPLVVDNTFASPALCRPAEHGAGLVVHSATKYIGGHHDLLGGIVCGTRELIDEIARSARDLGPNLAPFNAWLALRGLATLPLRVERASASALAVARSLRSNENIEAVFYPALDSDPSKPLADRLLGGRGGGTMGFDVTGGRERAAHFQELLQLIKPAASLGGTHTLIVHAPSVTHTQLGPDELRAAGISEGFCRLSVGLEEPADIIEDLEQALTKSA